jgi:hypothetical protein
VVRYLGILVQRGGKVKKFFPSGSAFRSVYIHPAKVKTEKEKTQ